MLKHTLILYSTTLCTDSSGVIDGMSHTTAAISPKLPLLMVYDWLWHAFRLMVALPPGKDESRKQMSRFSNLQPSRVHAMLLS